MSRITSYMDAQGRRWAVSLPDNAPESDASRGFLIGPPSLEALGLPVEVEVRLHNELFDRQLLTASDAKARRLDIFGALQTTFKVDTQRIVDLYSEGGQNAKREVKETAKGRQVVKQPRRRLAE